MNQESSFGRFVRQRRRELDLTQEELARRVGCAAITIRKIEADDARPSVQIAERLAMALGVPLDDRAEFVRRAREARPEPVEIFTPMPALEEIGNDDLSGRAIRGYALAEKIGDGGMGAVYRAVQPLVEREVAVKIILPAYANHPDFIRRFEAEAQLVARLEHPHIVPLYDYWREPGIAYLVMRLLRGGSVHTLLQDGPLPLATVNHLLEQICYALHAAHRIGVIHRDLKPDNVLLDEDHNAYLVDFGIAKNLGNPSPVNQTNVDMVLGSPPYFSPEQIRSASVRPQTDIYALGVMLYEMLTGSLPFTGPTPFALIQQHIGAPMPPLSARHDGLPAALDAVIARAAAKEPQDRYSDALALLDDFRRAAQGVLMRPLSISVLEEDEEIELINPYKGLRAFGEADVDDFFGRESLIQQLLARLGEGGDLARFLAVVGPSGSGKSSVVKAGLIPALRRGALVGSENWFVVDFLPGAHPFEELEAALLRVAVNPPASLLSQLREGERGLTRAVRRVLPTDEVIELVIVIDQFEEIFTLVTDEAERALFLSSLVTAVLDERSRVRVVMTLRADFTDRPLRYTDFGELLQRRSEFVLPLTPDEVERAIVGPARRIGLRLESGLVTTMIREVSDQPGTLPLLEYALTELFEKREGRVLTKAACETMGGVLGALGRRAEEVYRGLSDTEQLIARQIFLRLVTLGEGVEDTRRRVLREELESINDSTGTLRSQLSTSDTVLDVFGKHRLLTFDRDPITRGPTVEVAHEALLREWARLREWLNDSRADVRLQRLLAVEAAQWITAQREPSFLLIGARLEQFEGWALSTSISLTQDERAYLDASLAERDHQRAAEADRQRRELEAARQLAEMERESATRLRARNRVIAMAGGVALLLAMLAGMFGVQSNQNAAAANQNAQAAAIAQATSAANAAAAQQAKVEADTQRDAARQSEAKTLTQQRIATARELAASADNNLNVDPERSILLALQGVNVTAPDGFVLPEVENALHRAIAASRIEKTLNAHEGTAWALAYSPDGKRLATGGQDKTVRVWDTNTYENALTITAHDADVDSIAFSPDGKRLASSSDDGTAKIWDAATGQLQHTLEGHSDWVTTVAFHPDGTQLATISQDNSFKIWDVATGRELASWEIENPGPSLIYSPDGARILFWADNQLHVRDARSGEEINTIPAGDYVFALTPDGARLAIISEDAQSISVLDTTTNQILYNIRRPNNALEKMAFNADGSRLAAAGRDRKVHVWDAATGVELLTLSGHAEFVFNLAFSPDGKHLASAAFDGVVKIWSLEPSYEVLIIPLVGFNRLTLSPDGARIAANGVVNRDTDQDNRLGVWDAKNGKLIFEQQAHDTGGMAVAFSPDGNEIATGGSDQVLKTWDAMSGEPLLRLPVEDETIIGIAYRPDGKVFAAVGTSGMVQLLDSVTGKMLQSWDAGLGLLSNVAFNPAGSRLAVVSNVTNDAKIFDAATGKELVTLKGHINSNWGVDFNSDGTRVVTAGRDGTARLWDAVTGQLLKTFAGHTSTIVEVQFSPDDSRIATSSADGTVRVWDASTGEQLLEVEGSTGGAEFTPDGKRLIVPALTNAGIKMIALTNDELTQIAKSRLTRTWTLEECQKYLHTEKCP